MNFLRTSSYHLPALLLLVHNSIGTKCMHLYEFIRISWMRIRWYCHYKNEFTLGQVKWQDLPRELQHDVTFARSVVHLYTEHPQGNVLQAVPSLCDQRKVWWRIFGSREFRDCGNLKFENRQFTRLRPFIPFHIRSDRELMMKACRKRQCYVGIVDLKLATDRDFIAELLESHRAAHRWIFLSLLERWAMTTDLATRRFLLENILQTFPFKARTIRKRYFYDYLENDCRGLSYYGLWSCNNVAKAWFKAGLPLIKSALPCKFQSNKDFFLLIAEHGQKYYKRSSFLKASLELRRDKKFMMKVIEKDISLWSCASKELQEDLDLPIRAIARSPTAISIFLNEYENFSTRAAEKSFRERYLRRLRLYVKTHNEGIFAMRAVSNHFDRLVWHLIYEYLVGDLRELAQPKVCHFLQAQKNLALFDTTSEGDGKNKN